MKRLRIAQRGSRPLLTGLTAAALLLAAAGCRGGERAGTTTTTAANDVPTTVFGRQARELAVGVAARRRGQNVDVATTVLDQDGTRRRGLRVTLAAADGGWVSARPCGAGRYCGEVTVEGAQPLIRVRLARAGGLVSAVAVTLPRHPEPARAEALVRGSGAALRRLKSLIVNERLESGPPYPALITQFSYIAPDRLSYRIAGGGEAIVIGTHRWDRESSTGRWQESTQEPPRVPSTDWRRVRDASMLGGAKRDGRAVDMVSFYDPSVPAWFEAEIDRQTRLPLRLEMIAAAHFMTHTYGAFNAPLTILPP
jgi:hypothetical protein